jgi:hypothetical protein
VQSCPLADADVSEHPVQLRLQIMARMRGKAARSPAVARVPAAAVAAMLAVASSARRSWRTGRRSTSQVGSPHAGRKLSQQCRSLRLLLPKSWCCSAYTCARHAQATLRSGTARNLSP